MVPMSKDCQLQSPLAIEATFLSWEMLETFRHFSVICHGEMTIKGVSILLRRRGWFASWKACGFLFAGGVFLPHHGQSHEYLH